MEQVEHGEGAERAWEAAVTSWGWKEVVEAAGGCVGWATSQWPSRPQGLLLQAPRALGNPSATQAVGKREFPDTGQLGNTRGFWSWTQ